MHSKWLALIALFPALSVHAQSAAQQNQYFHHVLPGLNAGQTAPKASNRPVTYFNAARFTAFAIGPLTYKEFRRSDGSLGGLRNGGVGTGVRYYNGEQDDPYRDSGRNLAHREALRRCQQSDVVEGSCQVIAEAGNSCVAVAEGTGWRNSGGKRYRLYDRYYVVQLSPEERGNPQQSADEAQIKQWIASLANRAHQLCMADRSHPQHECQPVKDVWSGCGIDAVSSRYR